MLLELRLATSSFSFAKNRRAFRKQHVVQWRTQSIRLQGVRGKKPDGRSPAGADSRMQWNPSRVPAETRYGVVIKKGAIVKWHRVDGLTRNRHGLDQAQSRSALEKIRFAGMEVV